MTAAEKGASMDGRADGPPGMWGVQRYVWMALLGWTVIIASLLAWHFYYQRSYLLNLARHEGRAALDKDVSLRQWATMHGGVYVPVTDRTPANPFLGHLPERDLVTPSGRRLTLMNPAYMMRQLNELQLQNKEGIRGHITSLRPLRPENGPDPWEVQALRRFEEGATEVSSVEILNGQEYLRYMRPFVTTAGCLKCHAAQGYKVDDIRGGISVSVPLEPLKSPAARYRNRVFMGYGVLWFLGVGMIATGARKLRHQEKRRTEAETALRESEQKYRIISENTGDWEFWLDPAGAFIYTSPSCERVTGHRPQAFLDDPCLFAGLIHPEDARHVAAHRHEAENGVAVREELEFRIIRADGRVVWIGHVCQPVFDQDSRFLGTRGSNRDISARKQAEEELQRVRNYLANVIDSMPSVLVGMDTERKVTQWNRRAELETGIPSSQAIGRPIGALMAEFSPWIDELGDEIADRRPALREKLPLLKEGEVRYFDVMAYPLVANCVTGAVVRIEDVTERTRVQELMVQTEKMMSVGGLAAGMAHEINNPLGIISQAAQNIERRISPELTANRQVATELGLDLQLLQDYFQCRQIDQFLTSIRDASMRASRIVANMLQFSRQSEPILRPVGLAEVIDRTLELAASDYDLKKHYDFRGITIDRVYVPDLPPIPVVLIEIEQVILNLVKNAAQAMADNPPGRPPRITIRLKSEGCFQVIEVEDNGPGMAEEVRRRVFEPFFTTKAPGMGTGLGLSVSYLIVTDNHRGQMSVTSAPGAGTRFTIKLPLTAPKDS